VPLCIDQVASTAVATSIIPWLTVLVDISPTMLIWVCVMVVDTCPYQLTLVAMHKDDCMGGGEVMALPCF
jgi:hypothetical protein